MTEQGSGDQEAKFEDIQLVVFDIGSEEFGVAIDRVREIIPMEQITQVPRTPPFVKGVIDLRGMVIPVIDLQERFGIAAGEDQSQDRIIVVEMADQVVGCTVDSVTEVLTLPGDSVKPPPAAVASVDSEYLWGVGRYDERLLLLLDLDKVLSRQEVEELGAAAESGAAAERAEDAASGE
ncbi:MAG: chemotaxis protein CheW [Armatimonadia bacterium]|nr:chemotaxis protein CheW [Armatimonadia bacterium]